LIRASYNCETNFAILNEHCSQDQTELEQAIAQVRELQNEAFDQLVNEKLGADESFQIFITLSNDVLRQLGVENR